METAPEGFVYIPDFLSEAEQAILLRELRTMNYQHDIFRGQRLKRSYAQFGYAYVSTGRKLEATAPMPECLQAVIRKAQAHCPDGVVFNQCIVTHYPPGSGIGWHTDAPRFGECIVGVSLGSEARFQLRPNGTEEASYEIRAAPGSMYLLRGPARWEYQHQVVPVRTERYSLTFRHVAEEASDNRESVSASS
jgi:alkylated DNA repair protein (DNA oxidative demethylase)